MAGSYAHQPELALRGSLGSTERNSGMAARIISGAAALLLCFSLLAKAEEMPQPPTTPGPPAAASFVSAQPNRLIHESDRYLLLHAYNPVDWYPWSQEAFEKARRENKPIFLW